MKLALTACMLMVLGLCSLCFGGELTLEPAVLDNGGLGMLRYNGEPPLSAQALFNGKIFELMADDEGAWTLIGTDLETPEAFYPLQVRLTDTRGNTVSHVLKVEVRVRRREEERLSLPPEMVSPKKPAILSRIAKEKKRLDRIFSRTSKPYPKLPFVLPVDGLRGTPFGQRRILNGEPKSPHAGVDFHSSAGAPVVATGPGEVVFAGDLYFTGNTLILDHGRGLYSVYAHLRKILCHQGTRVEKGGIIGEVGSTGRSTGPHLHWGIKLRGDRVDPLAMLGLHAGEKP